MSCYGDLAIAIYYEFPSNVARSDHNENAPGT